MTSITSFSESDAILALTSSSYRRFSLSELSKATNNFDHNADLSGSIAYREYEANVSSYNVDGISISTLAVIKSYCYTTSFVNEVRTMICIKIHPNLITLIGYCTESDEKILVYKYMQNGRLADLLNHEHMILSWKKRVKICLQIAYGIQHLHRSTTEFPFGVSLGSVNSNNILFDENWQVKLSSFVLSAIGNSTKLPQDVHELSFLLIKVLRWNTQYYERFHMKHKEGDFEALVQKGSSDDDLSRDSLKAFCHAIRTSLEDDTNKRATIDEVVLDLEAALNFQDPQPIPITLDLINSALRDSLQIGVTESESLDNISEATNKSETILSASSSSFQFSSSSSSISLFSSSCKRFSMDEIKKATNNFDMKKCLGKGGEGIVYHAEISLYGTTEKSVVAVKHLHKSFTEQFEKEIATVAKFQHPNILSLLGYCQEPDDNVLIYEYMGNGNLSKYVNKNSKVCLSWQQRLNICLGVAKGLEHLHKKTDEFPKGIIHRDVKPENVLIDDNWVAKVSDFGMLKLSTPAQTESTVVTVNLKGTPGYFAPECLSSGKVSKKIDVYAFGFMMFEVLCRKKRWDTSEGESIYPDDEDDIGFLAEENVDIEIKDQISNYSRRLFIDIIVECMQSEPFRRPTMEKVVRKLEKALIN